MKLLVAILLLVGGCSLESRMPTVVQVSTALIGFRGQAVVIGQDGGEWVLLTCEHVVRGTDRVRAGGYIGTVRGTHEIIDLAIIAVPNVGQKWKPGRIGRRRLAVGETCYIVSTWSAGWGMSWKLIQKGSVSYNQGGRVFTNAGIVPGFSGSPICDKWGTIRGIISACLKSQDGDRIRIWETLGAGVNTWMLRYFLGSRG